MTPFFDCPMNKQRLLRTRRYSSTSYSTTDLVLVEFQRLDPRQNPYSVFLPQHIMKRVLLDSIPSDEASAPWELPKEVMDMVVAEALLPVSQPNIAAQPNTEPSSSLYTMEFPKIRRGSDLLGSEPDLDFFRQSRRINPYREDLTLIGHGAEYQTPQDGAYLMANDVWGRPTHTDSWGSTPSHHHKSPFVNRAPIDSSFFKPFTAEEKESISAPSTHTSADPNLSGPPYTNEPSQTVKEPTQVEIFHFRLPTDIINIMQGAENVQTRNMSTFQVTFPRNLVTQTLTEAVAEMKEDEEETIRSQNIPSAGNDSINDLSQEYFEVQERGDINSKEDIAADYRPAYKQEREVQSALNGANADASKLARERPIAAESIRSGLDKDSESMAEKQLDNEIIQLIRVEIETALKQHREILMDEVRVLENQAIQEVKEQVALLAQNFSRHRWNDTGLDFIITVADNPDPKELIEVEDSQNDRAAKPSFVKNLFAAKKAQAKADSDEKATESVKSNNEHSKESIAKSYVANLMRAVKRDPIFQSVSIATVEEIEREIKAAIKSDRDATAGEMHHAIVQPERKQANSTSMADMIDGTKKQTSTRFFETKSPILSSPKKTENSR